MMNTTHLRQLFISASLLFASPLIWACSYDGQFSNPFKESYPGALDVAIATQQAIDQNLITSPKHFSGNKGLRRVTWWLKLMAKLPLDLPNNAYIYLVDSQLWSQYQSDQTLQIHVSPPQNPEVIIQLTEATLHSLINNELTFEQAQNLGLISAT